MWSFILPHLVLIIGFAYKKYCSQSYDEKLQEHYTKAIENDELMKLLKHSIDIEIPIMFTLGNGKVYVGWPTTAPNPTKEIRFIRILPYISGYREELTHQVFFTSNYEVILETVDNPNNETLDHLTSEDFEILIPVDNLTSAHLFDAAAYAEFKKQ